MAVARTTAPSRSSRPANSATAAPRAVTARTGTAGGKWWDYRIAWRVNTSDTYGHCIIGSYPASRAARRGRPTASPARWSTTSTATAGYRNASGTRGCAVANKLAIVSSDGEKAITPWGAFASSRRSRLRSRGSSFGRRVRPRSLRGLGSRRAGGGEAPPVEADVPERGAEAVAKINALALMDASPEEKFKIQMAESSACSSRRTKIPE